MESAMASPVTKEKVLEENRRVHALENRLYLSRHILCRYVAGDHVGDLESQSA